MSYYYGNMNSNSLNTLFSSLSTNGTSGLSSMLSDYSSIRNGSYGKLLKSYYSAYGKDESSTSSSKTDNKKISSSTSTSKDTAARLTMVKSSSSALAESATKLVAKGKDSVFTDMDKAYSAVNSFVKDYNSAIKAAEDSNTTAIKSSADSMTYATKTNSKMLSEMGITINEDNTLSIDEDKFKKADINSVKSLFNASGSYGYTVARTATSLNSTAAYESTKTSTYTSKGSFSGAVSMGDMFDSLT